MHKSKQSIPFSEECDNSPARPMKLSAPTKVCLSITSNCNLDCRHCLAKAGQNGKDLTTRELFRIIDELAAEKVFFVSLFGGEPFTREDLPDIVAYLARFPIGISINTNATLIDDELARRLSRYRVSYVVSLDGSSAEAVDSIRGKGVFDQTVRGICALRSQDAKVLISTTVMSHNHRDLAEIAALGKELGVMGVRINTVFFINNAECYLDDILLTPEHYAHLYDTFQDLKRTCGSFLSGSLFQLMESVKSIHEDGLPEAMNLPEITVDPCGAGVNQCAIRPDGEVLPCVLLWNTPSGNLRHSPFKDIWDNSGMLDGFRSSFTLTGNEVGECMTCSYRYICYTGHRCSPYFIPGGIGNRKLFCIKLWMKHPEKA